jgi:6-phosphogluconolactonase
MKMRSWAVLWLAVPLILAGCKGFWDLPAGSGGSGTTTTTLSSGYFYLLDQATSQVVSYNIVSGTLTLVGSVTVPNSPIAITVAPNDQFLFVSTLNGIYDYTISDGSLTLGNSSQTVTGDPAFAMQVDSTDSWLVETSGAGTLNAVPIDSTNGDLNSSSPVCMNSSIICTVPLTGSTVNELAIAPDNQYVFVACGTNGTAAFSFTAGNANPFASGDYATINPITASTGAAVSVAVDPSNRLLYVGETNAGTNPSGGLRAFTIGTSGALKEISGSPFASGGTGPYAILPKPTADYVYVASWNGTSAGNITGFAIGDTDSTLSLTKLSSTATTGEKPMSMAEDSDHNFVLAASSGGSSYFDAYYFDTTTAGQLDLTITSNSYAAIALAANH